MHYLRQLLDLLSKKEKRKLILVFVGVLILGILELVGIGSIMPFLGVDRNSNMIQTNVYLKLAFVISRFTS
jgi:hypothetical protein